MFKDIIIKIEESNKSNIIKYIIYILAKNIPISSKKISDIK
jgi:hypothetical protein